MTLTPWGDSRDLRARRLRPGPGVSREDVDANQRERLFAAMVAAVAEHGYEATRVADLLDVSGVSRNAFYRLFDNKLDCFLATMDAIIVSLGAEIARAYREPDGGWDERLAAVLETIVATIVIQPATARVYYVESHAAGPRAVAKVEQLGDRVEELARQALADSPAHAGLPRPLLRAILRSMRRLFQIRLRSGREAELPAIAPQLLDWALGYETPPQALLQRGEPSRALFEDPPADADDPRERIVDAVIVLMAEHGYLGLTITDIAQRAAVSLTTFYDRFDGKDDAIVAALRRCCDRVLEAVTPPFRAAPDWAHGVGAAIDAFFAYMVIEQPFAQFSGVDAHLGSRAVVEVREALLAGAQELLLVDGFRAHDGVPPIAGEAIGAAIDALVFDQIANWSSTRLYDMAPIATYIALVPFVGVEQACAIANASR